MTTMTTMTRAESIAPVLEALEALDTLKANYASAVGTDSIVIRPDIAGGIIIAYASTLTYALESRADRYGNHAHRVNLEWYKRAADIPAEYRKAKRIATAVERHSAAALIGAHETHRAELAAHRERGF